MVCTTGDYASMAVLHLCVPLPVFWSSCTLKGHPDYMDDEEGAVTCYLCACKGL